MEYRAPRKADYAHGILRFAGSRQATQNGLQALKDSLHNAERNGPPESKT